jgi:small subunit ribosomal protein S16
MVVIRLARGGAKKRPFFNIVATDSRNPRDGRFIERVGFYNPVAADGELKFRVAADRLGYWTGVGAQMSPTVERLVKQFGAEGGVAPAGAGVAQGGEAAAA